MDKDMTINKDQKLYVMHFDGGCSTLGWEETRRRARGMAREMGIMAPVGFIGSEEMYREYQALCTCGKNRYDVTGKTLDFDLHPALIGLEGERIECSINGNVERFYVSKSAGYGPVHLKIPKSNSSGGDPVRVDDEITNVKRLGKYIN